MWPLSLIAGGSGVVPFRAMLRHLTAAAGGTPVCLLYSARSLDEVFYGEELLSLGSSQGVGVRLALTRARPDGWDGHRGRVTAELLGDVAWPPAERPLIEPSSAATARRGPDPGM